MGVHDADTLRNGAAIAITHIQVNPDRIAVDVRIDARSALTTPALAKAAAIRFPNLPHHTCVNSEGSSFDAVMDHTPLSHLLEHLVIDILTTTTSDPKRFSWGQANGPTSSGASRGWRCRIQTTLKP